MASLLSRVLALKNASNDGGGSGAEGAGGGGSSSNDSGPPTVNTAAASDRAPPQLNIPIITAPPPSNSAFDRSPGAAKTPSKVYSAVAKSPTSMLRSALGLGDKPESTKPQRKLSAAEEVAAKALREECTRFYVDDVRAAWQRTKALFDARKKLQLPTKSVAVPDPYLTRREFWEVFTDFSKVSFGCSCACACSCGGADTCCGLFVAFSRL